MFFPYGGFVTVIYQPAYSSGFVPPPPVGNLFLLSTGDDFLLSTGDDFLLSG